MSLVDDPRGPRGGIVQVGGQVHDADLGEDAHVDLKPEQGKDGQEEQGENDDITQVLDRVDDSTDDGLETGDHSN